MNIIKLINRAAAAYRLLRKPIIGCKVRRNPAKPILLSVMLFLLDGLGLVAADPPELSALVDPASTEHHVGKVIFAELATPDLAQAQQFYGSLFGWKFRNLPIDGGRYAEAAVGGRPIAGLMQKSGLKHNQQQAWLSFRAVKDVDALNTQAMAHGATQVFAPQTLPNRGREAVFTDEQGAVFAVLASSSGDPSDQLVVNGDWIWSSLFTSDPDAAASFYQTLFDYEVFELPADNGARHLLLATENYARASLNSLPDDTPNMQPHWLNYLRVENADAVAEKLLNLGGKVLIPPRLDRHGSKIALFADPAGAVFGVMEWPDNNGGTVSQ